jgi:hypothetical protein
VAVLVPFGTDLAALAPDITVSLGASISPPSGALQNFTAPVTYTVTAMNGSSQVWTVTAKMEPGGSIADIENYLGGVSGGTASNPVPLPVAVDLGRDWQNLLSAINNTGVYVALDLSACTMGGQEFDPGTAGTGENKIVSLVLPGAAVSVKAGTVMASTFTEFTSLKELGGENVQTIGNYAFTLCDSLSAVNLPKATSIGDEAFGNCTALSAVNLPKAASIGDSAFHTTALTAVNLPEATGIGQDAFYGCGSLIDVSLPKAVSIGNSAFHTTALTAVNLPEATGIGQDAFNNCGSLIDVSLPKVGSIGNYAFMACTALTTLKLPAGPPSLAGSDVFKDTNSGGILYIVVPPGAVDTYTTTWTVTSTTAAGGNTSVYGTNHKEITITATAPY